MPTLTLEAVAKSADIIFNLFVKEAKSLGQAEFRTLLHKTKNSKLIDVSTHDEFNHLHIPGSVNYDVLKSDFLGRLNFMDKSRPYFLYCRNGRRSETARRLMEELGFRRVYNLASGIQSWKGTLERNY